MWLSLSIKKNIGPFESCQQKKLSINEKHTCLFYFNASLLGEFGVELAADDDVDDDDFGASTVIGHRS